MVTKAEEILQQIDIVLNEYAKFAQGSQYDDLSDKPEDQAQMVKSRLSNTIDRFAPQNSQLKRDLAFTLNLKCHLYAYLPLLKGILLSLRREYELGYFQTVTQLVHADTFASFLEMSDYLLAQNYKDAAAVIAGSVLEQHLRELVRGVNTTDLFDVKGKPRKAESLNQYLQTQNIYNLLEQKSVTAWLDLRNKAAHGHYQEYDSQQVRLMINGVTDFMTRHPA